jgi:hypothetical protein
MAVILPPCRISPSLAQRDRRNISARTLAVMQLSLAELDECLADGEMGQVEYQLEIDARKEYEVMEAAKLKQMRYWSRGANFELLRRDGSMER